MLSSFRQLISHLRFAVALHYIYTSLYYQRPHDHSKWSSKQRQRSPIWLPVFMIWTFLANPIVYAITLPSDLTTLPPYRASSAIAWFDLVFVICMSTVLILAEAQGPRTCSHWIAALHNHVSCMRATIYVTYLKGQKWIFTLYPSESAKRVWL